MLVVSDPYVSSLLHLIRWCLLVNEGWKGITEGRKKEAKIPFKFQLYFWVSYNYSVAKKCLPGLLENSRVSQTRCWNIFVIFGGWYVQSRWLCPVGVFHVAWEQRRLLSVEKWASMLLRRHVVFPTSNRKEMSFQSRCWERDFFLTGETSICKSFWELLPFEFILFYFLLISTDCWTVASRFCNFELQLRFAFTLGLIP